MNVYHIDEYPLHCHEDAIEIILVLKGAVKVKASFEFFTLSQGDYVVVNREDSHKIWRQGAADNLVAVFHISLKPHRAAFPHLDYVIFACESFDLAKYKGQADLLRRLLLALADSLLRRGRKTGRTADITARLLERLVREYSLEQYYNRSGRISDDRLSIYYTVMKYIYEEYPSKTILQDIASREFFSKSYISHLFKEVGAASFQDILGYVRVYKAERLLLETDRGITGISEQCGFSDNKYFSRTFQKWFRMNPSEYRKIYQAEIGTSIKAAKATGSEVAAGIRHLEDLADDPAECKVSMTPITLKNIGSKTDLMNCLRRDTALAAPGDSAAPGHYSGPAYAIIRIGAAGNAEQTQSLLEELLRDLQQRVAGDLEYWFVK